MAIINESAQNVLTIAQSSVCVDVIDPDVYGSVIRGNRYFDNRLRNSYWVNASVDDRKRALIEATRIVDNLNYSGTKTDPSQLHQFPRTAGGGLNITPTADTAVPADVEVATYEIALQLLSGIDPDIEVENLAASAQGFSTARTTYDRTFVLEHIAAGVPSATAWKLLRPFLRDPRKLSISRVN